MYAHRGVTVDYGNVPIAPVRLGSSSSPINISEVVSTAQTETAELGEIGGKGVSDGKLDYEYSFTEFGVVMILQSVTTFPEYPVFLNPHNSKFSVTDYYQPESDRLGMQPLSFVNTPWSMNSFSKTGNIVSDSVFKSLPDDTFVLGWQPRYAEYKNACDINHLGYSDKEDMLSSYVMNKITDLETVYTLVNSQGSSTTNKNPFVNVIPNNLHIQPKSFDTLFMLNSNGDPYTDNFDFNALHEIKLIRPMSVSGMPILNV